MKPFVLVWDTGMDVPQWAWDYAGIPTVRIACYGQYENALEFNP